MTDDAAPDRPATTAQDYTPNELAAWSGFLRTHASVTRSLSAALELEHRLTINEFEVLLTLFLGARLRLRELGRRVHLTPSGMSGMVDRLKTRGLIQRCVDPDDARAGYLVLTEHGRKLFHEASAAHVNRVKSRFLARFTADELDTLIEFWDRFHDEPGPAAEPQRHDLPVDDPEAP